MVAAHAGLVTWDLSVSYGSTSAVAGVDLSVAPGEVVVVLGPSGSGKSTLLRGIVGLEPLSAGGVTVGGADVSNLPPHRRGVGLMFQDYALFPHRSVRENVAFGLRMQGSDRREISARTDAALELVGLEALAARSVTSLSGGEQQRVALARALAPRPSVLLLDEPLGSLDRDLRQRLLSELAAILDDLEVATLYVTHDQEEAFALADTICIMRAGEVVASSAPEELWQRPPSAFAASFLGLGTLVDARADNGSATTPWGTKVPASFEGAAALVVRPQATRLDTSGQVEGRVRSRRFRAGTYVIDVETTFATLEVEVAIGGHVPDPGAAVCLAIDDAAVAVVVDDRRRPAGGLPSKHP